MEAFEKLVGAESDVVVVAVEDVESRQDFVSVAGQRAVRQLEVRALVVGPEFWIVRSDDFSHLLLKVRRVIAKAKE